MSRRPCTFRQRDLTAALKSARETGFDLRVDYTEDESGKPKRTMLFTKVGADQFIVVPKSSKSDDAAPPINPDELHDLI